MSTRAERSVAVPEREWWRRLVSVLVHPREVFEGLRDDSRRAGDARQEPLTALVFVTGIGIFLSTPTAARLYDSSYYQADVVTIVFEALLGGLLLGLQNFWLLGGTLYLGARGADGEGSYRQARHLVALATTPFVLSLVLVWPVRLALYGTDLFRRGGSDAGAGGDVFRGLDAGFLVWTLVLLVIGVRTVNTWTWRRSLGALGLAGVFVALLVALAVVL
jgi:hypothetical protein